MTRSLLRLLALALSVMLLATACGADDADGDDQPDVVEDDATEDDPEPTDDGDDDEATEEDADDEAEPTEEATDDVADGVLTVYSGRNENLVGPLIEQFTADTGIEVEVRYGDTAELAAQILDEGANSPADVYFGQDAGALGALQAEGVLTELPSDILDLVEPRFRSPEGNWIGASGRARVLTYNTDVLSEGDLPDSVLDLTDEEWRGRVSWAPTNGSLQAFVTAMRILLGEDEAREWVQGMIDNDVQVYENNASQVEAVGNGEVDIALVNNYYLPRIASEDPDIPAANYYFPGEDVGSLINIAGLAILDTSDQVDAAEAFVAYLLSEDAQVFFAEETYEFPLVTGVTGDPNQPSLEEVDSPDIDLSDLADLQGTLDLLIEVGAI